MLRRVVVGLLFLAATAAAQWAQVQFARPGATYSQILVNLPSNRLLLLGTQEVTSSVNPVVHTHMAAWAIPVVALNPVGQPPISPLPGGNGNDIPHAAAVDANGNIWIAGETDSDDFPLVNPVVAQKAAYRRTGFVMELDSNYNVLFSTYLGGVQKSALPYASRATAIALDASGNAYIGGQTDEPDFPTTPGAVAAGHPGADSSTNTFFYSFAAQISAAGKLVYSALLTTGTAGVTPSTFADVRGVAVDASGAATVTGIQQASNGRHGVYVARLASGGSKLVWLAVPQVPYGIGDIRSLFMGQDGNGNVDLFGSYTTLLAALPVTFGPPGLFAAQVKADGSGLSYSIDLGTWQDADAAGMTVDASGRGWLAGTSSSRAFPAAAANVPLLGSDFVLRIDPSGANPETLFRLPHGSVTAAPALYTGGNGLLLLGEHGALMTIRTTYPFDSTAIVGFANAASLDANSGIAAGALVTIWGFEFPASPQVLFGAFPATVLYAGSNQINVQVPFEDFQGSVSVSGQSGSASFQPPLTRAIGIFTTDGVHAAALNQDGSVNSLFNEAMPGSVVTIYGTGAVWPAGMQDGATAAAAMPLDQERNQFQVVDGIGTPLSILYAGAAPGIIKGVFQINVQLTPGVLMPLKLISKDPTSSDGMIVSNPVQVYLRQP